MDRITTDLLANGSIMQTQVERLLDNGQHPHLVLKDITMSGFMTMDRLVRFIVEQIRNGVYQLSIIDNYEYIHEKDVLQKLASELDLIHVDLDSIDMDYDLLSKVSLTQLQKYNALPLFEDDTSVTIAFNDPLNIEAQESIQRLFPRKPIDIAIATKKQIKAYLFKVELKDSIKGLIKSIREELNSIETLNKYDESSSILLLIDVILKTCIKLITIKKP